MSKSINLVVLAGALGKDAVTKFTPSGQAVTNFSVATNYSWKDKQSGEWRETTEWTNCTLWGQEKLGSMLTKGSKVTVTGRLATRSYEDKDGNKKYVTEVITDSVVLGSARPVQEDSGGGYSDFSDDAPF